MKHLYAIGAIGAVAMSAGVAAAADLPVRSPPPAFVAAPVFTWTGCYAGLHAGYGGGRLNWQDDTVTGAEDRTNNNQKGGFAGAQIGCNYQFNAFVVGLQGDVAASDLRSKLFRSLDANEPENYHTRTRWFGSVTGRLGYAFDRFLVYGKGGVAFAQLQHRFQKFDLAVPEVSTFSGRSNRVGWTIGAGVEYAFNNSWSGFAEYNYMHFGQKGFSGTLTDDAGTETENYRSSLKVHAIKVGVNYKFW